MENASYPFLNSEQATKYFADADIALKQGRHIQDFGTDIRLFSFIDEFYEKGLEDYYKQFFGMNLVSDKSDNGKFYYLDFPDDGKGKFGKENRSKELEDDKVIFAILFLNLYKERFFEQKEFTWQDLEQIFKEGEHKELWQKILFTKVKQNYTPREEQDVKDKVKKILSDFEKLGWIVFKNQDEIHFEVLPSIERISRLYGDVIDNLESIEEYLNNEQLS
ncbi:MAG: chromosome partition protein MukE [Bacteroidia bacterium]|nr:chromosome partition protein MukE [Bacteroidia bacterium]